MTVETPRPTYEHITPSRAEQLLARMPVNRRLKPERVKVLVSAMVAGDFDPYNGESIKIDAEGNLIDGQHRLQAIVNSRIPSEMLVVRGVQPTAIYTVDTGVARSLNDALTINGEVGVSYLSSAIRGGWSYAHGTMGDPSNNLNGPTTTESLRFLEQHPSLRDSSQAAQRYAVRARSHGRMLTPIVYGPLHWAFSKYDATEAEFFFDRVSLGDGLAQDNPIWILRRTVTNLRNSKNSVSHLGTHFQAITIKAWNAWMEGRTIGVLRYTPGGSKPEEFPTPVGHEVIMARIAQEASDNALTGQI